jgi:hypothetical protein
MMAAAVAEGLFEATERYLTQWGRWARRTADKLGYPQSSSVARMIEMVKVHKPQPEGVKATAKGKETRSFRPVDSDLPPADILAIDAAVARLSGVHLQAVSRAYRFGQPDRIAAKELRISRELFRERREGAVRELSQVLVQQGILRYSRYAAE